MQSTSMHRIARMPARVLVATAAVLLTSACGQRDTHGGRDTAGATGAGATHAARSDANWLPELGTGLLVPSDSDSTAILLFPTNVEDLRSSDVTLVTAAADTNRARIDTAGNDQQCGDAPIVRVAARRPAWSAGFVGLIAQPLHMDSIEAMTPRDSARLAADIARLASGLTASDTNEFRGLPFVVQAAHRLAWTDRDVLVAHLVRRLNQEASPREEHTLLIAERPRTAPATAFSVVFSQRSAGTEETVEHFDVLSALRTPRALVLLIARDQEARTEYDLLERATDSTWRARWTRIVGC